MARMMASWLSGPDWEQGGVEKPSSGPGPVAGFGRRLLALALDWLIAYGLAGLALATGVVSFGMLSTAVLVIWLLLGALAVRLFGFTPGQFAFGLRVAPVVGLGRALIRGLLIALVIPALFTDADGRGLQDRATGTTVVRR